MAHRRETEYTIGVFVAGRPLGNLLARYGLGWHVTTFRAGSLPSEGLCRAEPRLPGRSRPHEYFKINPNQFYEPLYTTLEYKITLITPLPAQISASNFHDLTQITQRRVCFNPKRTEKPKAHGFSVRFGLKHTLREVVVVLIANITLRRGVI